MSLVEIHTMIEGQIRAADQRIRIHEEGLCVAVSDRAALALLRDAIDGLIENTRNGGTYCAECTEEVTNET